MLHFFVLAQARTAAFAICSLKMAWGWWTISLSWLMTLLHLLFMPLACKPRHRPWHAQTRQRRCTVEAPTVALFHTGRVLYGEKD